MQVSEELAHVVAEKSSAPDLTGPAHALSLRANNDVENGVVAAGPDGIDTVWVSPTDIMAQRTVPLPAPVAQGLRQASQALVSAAQTAGAAAATYLCQADLTVARATGPAAADRTGPDRLNPLDRSPSLRFAPWTWTNALVLPSPRSGVNDLDVSDTCARARGGRETADA